MSLDLKKFYQATNPAKTLDINKPEDAKYYIDFSEVRGNKVIEDLITAITWSDENLFTCNLFTGHIGCGKSTELLRLKKKLEDEKFHVVYFESDEDLDMGNLDISDILLAIAKRVSQSLEPEPNSEKATPFKNLLEKGAKLLQQEISINAEGKIPGVGDFKLGTDFEEDFNFSLSTVIGKITTTTKKDTNVRDRLRAYLEPKTDAILGVLNKGLFEPTNAELQRQGKKGLVVIVDNLDRVSNVKKSSGKLPSEYLFGDRGADLNRLHCHVVYTMPLALRYSPSYSLVKERFKGLPVILPMVSVRLKNGEPHTEGMALLKQMVLARAFPELTPEQRLDKITEVFDNSETLDELCFASGGHVRNLLRLLNPWIMKDKKLPLSRTGLEAIIRGELNEKIQGIVEDDWNLLRQVQQNNTLPGDDAEKEKLIGNLSVYEYQEKEISWYDVNPILKGAEQLSK